MKRFIVASALFLVGLVVFCWGFIGESQLAKLVTEYPVTESKGRFVLPNFVPRGSGDYELYLLVPVLNDAPKVHEVFKHQLSISIRVAQGDTEIYRSRWPEGEDTTEGASGSNFVAGLGGFDAVQDGSYVVELSFKGAEDFVSQRALKLKLCYSPAILKDLEINYELLSLSGEALGALGLLITIVQLICGLIRRPRSRRAHNAPLNAS